MGKLEESGKKRAKKRNLKKAILHAASQAMLIAGGIQMRSNPGAARVHHALAFEARNKSAVSRAKRQLLASALVYEKDGRLLITKKGREILQTIDATDSFSRRHKKTWDGRWRLLIFDIPEKLKSMRDKIRRTLLQLGFVRLQDSVWIYPYDCEDYIALLKADLRIGKELLYIIVDELEGDEYIRKEFGLQ